MAFFDVPLNLPHAGTVAWRIQTLLGRDGVTIPAADSLAALLQRFRVSGDEPLRELVEPIRLEALELGRRLVDVIEDRGLGEDRLGQCVRNLFECLEEGEEGAAISLRAGENPYSLQRP